MQKLIEDKDFTDFISNNEKVLVKFSAVWCAPCRVVKTVFDDLIEKGELPDDLALGDVDVDNSAFLAGKYGIETLPTMILFVNGVEVKRHVGSILKSQILEFVQ